MKQFLRKPIIILTIISILFSVFLINTHYGVGLYIRNPEEMLQIALMKIAENEQISIAFNSDFNHTENSRPKESFNQENVTDLIFQDLHLDGYITYDYKKSEGVVDIQCSLKALENALFDIVLYDCNQYLAIKSDKLLDRIYYVNKDDFIDQHSVLEKVRDIEHYKTYIKNIANNGIKSIYLRDNYIVSARELETELVTKIFHHYNIRLYIYIDSMFNIMKVSIHIEKDSTNPYVVDIYPVKDKSISKILIDDKASKLTEDSMNNLLDNFINQGENNYDY